MNNMLTDMYRGSASEPTRKPATTQNEFPIDISSDESDDNSMPKTANNGTHLMVFFQNLLK